VFDQQEQLGLPKLTFLNIGGGFSMVPNDENESFMELASKLSSLIE
jgi:hypothetical protein